MRGLCVLCCLCLCGGSGPAQQLQTDLQQLESLLASAEREVVVATATTCFNTRSLDDIAQEMKADKSSQRHNFAAFYEQELRGKKIGKVVEVGVRAGPSLKMWKQKYPCAAVWGFDKHLRRCIKGGECENYTLKKADQEDPASLNAAAAGQQFDLVVDDGGHTMKQQQTTLATMWEHVAPCGAFIMEDLHTSNSKLWPGLHKGNIFPTTLAVMKEGSTSPLVDFARIKAQASSIKYFEWGDANKKNVKCTACLHVTAVIHKKCLLLPVRADA